MYMKIDNGLIIDGTNSQPFKGDIIVKGDTIVNIYPENDHLKEDSFEFKKVINAEGLVVSPGFLDIHSHSDVVNFVYESADSKILQGVTTEIAGNCGVGTFPTKPSNVESYTRQFNRMTEIKYPGLLIPWNDLDSYFEALSQYGTYPNLGLLIGHGPLRANVIRF